MKIIDNFIIIIFITPVDQKSWMNLKHMPYPSIMLILIMVLMKLKDMIKSLTNIS